MENYDYTTAGLDGFLSRSIDNLPQANLDSPGSNGTQLRWDNSQLSGGIGDKFSIGDMKFSGRDNSFTVNGGSIAVNSTNNDSSILASDALLTYKDSNGNVAVREGVLDDNTVGLEAFDTNSKLAIQLGRYVDSSTGLRIIDPLGNTVGQFGRQFDGSTGIRILDNTGKVVATLSKNLDNTTNMRFLDANGIGLAQFGQFSGGTLALKVAKAGIEVSTATNDQLIFNSAQDMLKVIAHGSIVLTPANSGSPNFTVAAGGYSTTVDLSSYGLTSQPAIIAYFQVNQALTSGTGQIFTTDPQAMPYTTSLIAGNTLATIFFSVNTSTLTLWYNQWISANWSPALSITFYYYVLQETIT